MRHSELQNFTHEELSNFKYEDLELDKYELIAKAENSSIVLPEDVQEKLFSLCTELKERVPKDKHFSPINRLQTVGDVVKLASYLISTIKNLNDLGLGILLKQSLDAIYSLLK